MKTSTIILGLLASTLSVHTFAFINDFGDPYEYDNAPPPPGMPGDGIIHTLRQAAYARIEYFESNPPEPYVNFDFGVVADSDLAASVMDNPGGYSVKLPSFWLGATGSTVSGGTLRYNGVMAHSYIKKGSTIIAERFTLGDMEISLPDGAHDLKGYFCSDSGYQNCFETPFRVFFGDDTAFLRVTGEITTPPFGGTECFYASMEISDGQTTLCAPVTGVDPDEPLTGYDAGAPNIVIPIAAASGGQLMGLAPITNVVRGRMSADWNALCSQDQDVCHQMSLLVAWAGFNGGRCEERLFQEAVQDGVGNALQHAIWNAAMARLFGAQVAKQWADAQEPTHCGVLGAPSPQEAMDCANNELGRQVGISAEASGPRVSLYDLAILIAGKIRAPNSPYVVLQGSRQCPNGW